MCVLYGASSQKVDQSFWPPLISTIGNSSMQGWSFDHPPTVIVDQAHWSIIIGQRVEIWIPSWFHCRENRETHGKLLHYTRRWCAMYFQIMPAWPHWETNWSILEPIVAICNLGRFVSCGLILVYHGLDLDMHLCSYNLRMIRKQRMFWKARMNTLNPGGHLRCQKLACENWRLKMVKSPTNCYTYITPPRQPQYT